jgi:thymidine phosphorylase
VRAIDDPTRLPTAAIIGEVRASRSGVIAGIAPRPIGHAIIALGGGRTRKEDVVDPAVGVVLQVRVGDRVSAGDVLATVHAATEDGRASGTAAVTRAIHLADGPAAEPLPWVIARLAGESSRPADRPH